MALPLDPKKLAYYELHSDKKHLTGVDRGYLAQFADPLTLNFKILVNFEKQYGLLADEKYENSALAYLKRIGDDVRYNQLLQWIEVFKVLIKEYDFLMLEVEGLDTQKLAKPYESFNEEEDKITIVFRETSDMLVESLVSTYRHIWFDDNRCVEVLPSNLRKFDISILLFSGGYFNAALYDDDGAEKPAIEKLIFPTRRKLADNNFKNTLSEKFNHVLFNFGSCSFVSEEFGKMFLETISNEPGGDMVKNNITFSYKFANVKGRFNNIMGDYDFVAFLALMAAQNKATTTSKNAEAPKKKIKEQLKDSFDSLKKSTMKTLETKKNNQLKKVTSSSTPIGELISKFTVKNAEMMIKNTLDVGINYIEQKAINDPLAKLNNMLFQNFSNNLIDIYKNNFGENQKNNIELMQNNTPNREYSGTHYTPENAGNVQKGVSFGTDNIYTRGGF